MKTTLARKEDIERKWYLLDANDQTLGRFACKVARLLMGKDKPLFTPHVDAGDHVIVVNATKIRVTGNKTTDKLYRWHTFYPGGMKERTLKQMMEEHPERVIELAVKCMLPKNRQQDPRMTRLHIYTGGQHPHEAQKAITLT
jgi:large subunit ribosomal protein L13